MRKLALATVAVLALLSAACACPAERKSVDRLEEQHEKLFKKYEAYVMADAKLDAAAKDDEKKLLQSIRDIVDSLQKALKE